MKLVKLLFAAFGLIAFVARADVQTAVLGDLPSDASVVTNVAGFASTNALLLCTPSVPTFGYYYNEIRYPNIPIVSQVSVVDGEIKYFTVSNQSYNVENTGLYFDVNGVKVVWNSDDGASFAEFSCGVNGDNPTFTNSEGFVRTNVYASKAITWYSAYNSSRLAGETLEGIEYITTTNAYAFVSEMLNGYLPLSAGKEKAITNAFYIKADTDFGGYGVHRIGGLGLRNDYADIDKYIGLGADGIPYWSDNPDIMGTAFVLANNNQNITFKDGTAIRDEAGHNVIYTTANTNYFGAVGDYARLNGAGVDILSLVGDVNITTRHDFKVNGVSIGQLITNAAPIDATYPAFSNAVLAVGLNIDTNSVAVLNEIANDFGGFPLDAGETATSVGGLLLALAAAIAWLKKNKLNKADVSAEYESGLKIATVGDVNVYVPDETKLVVTLVTQDGVTVTGVKVIVHNGDSASSPIAHERDYNGHSVEFDVGDGFQYYIEVSGTLAGHFNPHVTAGAQTGIAEGEETDVTFTYDDTTHVSTISALKTALDAGAGEALVGCDINDTWTDENGTTYNSPWKVTAVKTYVGADGAEHTGAKLVRKYANKDNVQFDAANTELATEETAHADIYYYGLSGTTYTLLSLAEGDTIPYSDYDKVYKNAVKDTTFNIIRYGHNRYLTSAIRQYLNSDAAKGAWWTQQHVGQVAPSSLSSLRGWKAGCSAEILAYAKPVHFQTYGNSVCDGSVIDDMCDLFWLDSGTEDYGSVNANEGTYDKYWKDATGLTSPSNANNTGRIHYRVSSTGSACVVWLRSPLRGTSCNAWNVSTSGNVSGSYASYTGFSAAPACVIY